jgi:acetyl-CoA acyltransferase
MSDIVIAGYKRSPFTFAFKGELAKVRPDTLLSEVVRVLVDESGLDPATIEDIQVGTAFPEGEQGFNLARMVGLMAGLPQAVAGSTLNRFCGSSMQSIHNAAGLIKMGAGESYIAAGVESMTRVPMPGFNPAPNPELMESHPGAYMSMGETAENVADLYQIPRDAQEAMAVNSHAKAAAARAEGRLSAEIVPIATPSESLSEDRCIREQTSADKLATLKPAFRAKGSVTAATSSPLTDGAAATLVCSADYAARHGLTPLAKIRAIAVAGCDPKTMGLGPIFASRKALKRAGLDIKDIDIIEINEAFASQALACIQDLDIDPERVNLDGGAMALGHPLGATGARITGKAAALLAREGKSLALATQCIGGGQGIATILETA